MSYGNQPDFLNDDHVPDVGPRANAGAGAEESSPALPAWNMDSDGVPLSAPTPPAGPHPLFTLRESSHNPAYEILDEEEPRHRRSVPGWSLSRGVEPPSIQNESGYDQPDHDAPDHDAPSVVEPVVVEPATVGQTATDSILEPWDSPALSPTIDTAATFSPGLEQDPRFLDAVAKMQAGLWPEVRTLLYALEADYPQASLLPALINEAELKANLVMEWDQKIKGRRLTLHQQIWLRKTMPYTLVLVLFVCGWVFYQSYIAPSRQVVAMARASETMLEEALTLVQTGRYAEGIELYNTILVTQPENAAALAGRADATRMASHGEHYRMAQEVAAAGNYERALSFLHTIQAESPNFRDVEAKIVEYERLLRAQGLFAQAEEAYLGERWVDALALYRQIQEFDSGFQRPVLEARLPEVYLEAGRQLLLQRPQKTDTLVQVRDYLRLGMDFDKIAANQAIAQLDVYAEGAKARDHGELKEAISHWRPLYDQEPQLLGGLLAEELYYIYLVRGTDAAADGDLDQAASLFEQATQLNVPDSSEAQKRLAIVTRA